MIRLRVITILEQDGEEFDRMEWIKNDDDPPGHLAGRINYACYDEGMEQECHTQATT